MGKGTRPLSAHILSDKNIKEMPHLTRQKQVQKMQVLMILMICHAMVVHSQVNILESFNGDFEDGLNYWRLFEVPVNNGSYAAISEDAMSGNFAMQINYATDHGNIIDRGFDNWLAGVPVNEGVLYTVKAFSKGDSNATVRLVNVQVTFGFFDAKKNAISQSVRTYPLTGAYKEFSFSKKAPSHASSCWLAFRLFDATDPCAPFRNMHIDNVRILRPNAVSVESPVYADSKVNPFYNHPHPFNEKTTIAYELHQACTITLMIFDVFGQDVEVLAEKQKQDAGYYEELWMPGDLSAGIYFYSLEVLSGSGEKTVLNRKMVLGK